jgi:predicted xylose isomerase-like sugar epimerase
MTRFLKGLMLTAILAVAPCGVYSQCTDSSTKAEINLYLAEGAKARALVPLYQERIKIDSLEIVQHKAAVEHLQQSNSELTQKLSLWRIIAPLAFVVGLIL